MTSGQRFVLRLIVLWLTSCVAPCCVSVSLVSCRMIRKLTNSAVFTIGLVVVLIGRILALVLIVLVDLLGVRLEFALV